MNGTRSGGGFRRSAIAAAAAALVLLPAAAPAFGPLGDEFPVNQYTTSPQGEAAVAMDADGDTVVVWNSGQQDGSGYGIYARRYAADGRALGNEFQVHQYTTDRQVTPAVAMDAEGDFVIVWTSDGQDGAGEGVFMRRYSSTGTALGNEVQVNQVTAEDQNRPQVAMQVNGDFVVVWTSRFQDGDNNGIYARRYFGSGNPKASEFRVNQYTTSLQDNPTVAVSAVGDFVIAWTSFGQDGDGRGVYARRYRSSGAALGDEFRVNVTTTAPQDNPSAAMDADGDFVIAWNSELQDGALTGVYARRYAANGAASGGEFQVNQYTSSSQGSPSVAMQAEGDFVVAWSSNGQDGSYTGIYGRRYSAAGAPLASEFRINQLTQGSQFSPSVASDADGDFFTAWNTLPEGALATDLVARRYTGDNSANLSVVLRDEQDPLPGGQPARYTATVTNLRAAGAPTGQSAINEAIGSSIGVELDLVAPAGSVISGIEPGVIDGVSTVCTPQDSSLHCTLPIPLPAGRQLQVRYAASTPGDRNSTLVSTASVSSQTEDSNLANNEDIEATTLNCRGVLAFSTVLFAEQESASAATVTVGRTGGSCGAASVQVDTASGSATAGLDFVDVGGVLSWADGDAGDKTLSIPLVDDSLDEVNERVMLSLSNPEGASLARPSTARLMITDDDPSPRVNFTTTAQTASENQALVTVTVQLSALSGRPVVVPLLRSGTATSDSDYVQAETALTIPAGSRSASFDVEVVDDLATEPSETIVLSLGAPLGAVTGTASVHTLTITDNDTAPLPTVSFTAATSSGDEATPRSAVLTLSAASAQAITVPFTVSGTATQGGDYTLNRSTPITFNPGVTQLGIQIVPVDDTVDELNETAILTLGTPTGASLGATTVHTRTIVDNDP